MEKTLNVIKVETVTLQDLIDNHYIRVIKASELPHFKGTRKYLSTSSINSNGIVDIESIITYANKPSRASMIPVKNSVWFAKMKNTVKVFKSQNNDENEYVLSTGFYGILCNENLISSDWMKHIFKSKYFNAQKDKYSEGSSMSGIKDNQLSDINVKIFQNKADEKKIVSILESASINIRIANTELSLLIASKRYLLENLFI